MTPQCKKCKVDMRLVPAGTSKAGNSYNSFYGCPNRECKETAKAPKQPVKQDMVQVSIHASVALNNASLILSRRTNGTTEEQKKETLRIADEFVIWLKEQVEPF